MDNMQSCNRIQYYFRMVRLAGFEPAPKAWEASVLPLDYSRTTFDLSVSFLKFSILLENAVYYAFFVFIIMYTNIRFTEKLINS